MVEPGIAVQPHGRDLNFWFLDGHVAPRSGIDKDMLWAVHSQPGKKID